jgi:hypothetical protein
MFMLKRRRIGMKSRSTLEKYNECKKRAIN